MVTSEVRRTSLVVALAAFAAFGGSLASGFHFDDYGMLQDPAIVSPDGWTRCWGLLQTRPLTWFTFWINFQITGRNPFLWHLINVALHVTSAVVLYRLLRQLTPKVALFGSLVFAVHPILAESVDYVYARATVLCALFALLAFIEWIRGRDWIAVLWFALALLSKEECASVPLVLALYSFREGELWRRFIPLTAMLALALAAGLRVIAAIHTTGMKNIGANAGISPLTYLSEQGIAILRYLGLVVFPWAFSVDPEIPVPDMAWRVIAWVVLLALIVVAAMKLRSIRAAFWILAGLILLIPSSTIFPAADLAADRRMYLPMAAFAAAIALLLPVAKLRWLTIVPVVLAALSIERAYVWASDERLWGEAMELAPSKVRPRIQYSRAVPPDRAIPVLKDAEQIAPQDPDVASELTRVYLELHRPADALAEVGRALALSPRSAHMLNNRGAVLLSLNQAAAARRDFVAALAIEPCLTEARDNLARSGGIPADAPPCSSTQSSSR